VRKLDGGPGVYEGLWWLVEQVYRSLATGSAAPVTLDQIEAVNRLTADIYAGAGERAAG
jgi:hypothetical protein